MILDVLMNLLIVFLSALIVLGTIALILIKKESKGTWKQAFTQLFRET